MSEHAGASSKAIKVWGRATSNNVKKVMWCIGELGVPHERIDWGGKFGGQADPAYLARNPNGRVPCIEDGGLVLWESNAIVRYLASQYGHGSLWPADNRARADADRWMDWQVSSIVMHDRVVRHGLIRTNHWARDNIAIEVAQRRLAQSFGTLDKVLADRPFLAGDTFTMGDIPLGVMAFHWFSFPMERPALVHFERWYRRLAEREAFKTHVAIPLN